MTYRIRILATLAATLSATLLASPATATPGDPEADTQPCVSQREWHGLYEQVRPELEKRWEVEGLGIDVILPFGLVSELTVYPRCGYSMDTAWYGITYKQRGKNWWAVRATQCAVWMPGVSCAIAGL